MCVFGSLRKAAALGLGLALVLVPGPVTAEKGAGATPSGGTEITSERVTVQNKQRRAIFEGQVVLTKGDLVVRSDVMVVFYTSGEAEETSVSSAPPSGSARGQARGQVEVSRIEATGRVQIEKEAGRATCRKAVYYQDEQKIVLTGEPVAWQRGNRVSGKQITMFLDSDRTVVEGGSRVLLEEPEVAGP